MADLSLRADKLEQGMRLRINGQPWMVDKVKVKGKLVKLTVTGRQGTFTREVKAKATYEIDRPAERAKAGKVPLRDERNAQARWATQKESDRVLKAPRKIEPPVKPDVEPDSIGWDDDAGKADKRVRKILGGELLAVKPEGSDQWFVPEVGPDTIAAHLLTFHGLTFDGVSIDDARALPEAETTLTAAAAMQQAAYELARRLHDDQHAQFQAGKIELPTPHWHSKERPRLSA